MKRINILGIIFAALLLTATLSAQESEVKNKAEVKILTSSQCEMCKERIEKALADVDGIISATLDVETKILTAVYNPEVISPDDIREEITEVGYDADDMPANKRAYKKLPKCCQKGGHD